MKKFVKIISAAVLVFVLCAPVWADRPKMSRAQYKKNVAYNKNFLPAGWQYEAGYAVWRMNRKLPVNRYTYKRYKNDRTWHNRMRRYYRPEQLALNTLDWTVEEIALFIQQNQDYFKFHPAGYED